MNELSYNEKTKRYEWTGAAPVWSTMERMGFDYDEERDMWYTTKAAVARIASGMADKETQRMLGGGVLGSELHALYELENLCKQAERPADNFEEDIASVWERIEPLLDIISPVVSVDVVRKNMEHAVESIKFSEYVYELRDIVDGYIGEVNAKRLAALEKLESVSEIVASLVEVEDPFMQMDFSRRGDKTWIPAMDATLEVMEDIGVLYSDVSRFSSIVTRMELVAQRVMAEWKKGLMDEVTVLSENVFVVRNDLVNAQMVIGMIEKNLKEMRNA